MQTTGNTILITGGGSGIGRALAQRWHDRGNRVIVAGRRLAALEETIAGRANMAALTVDIDDASAIRAFAAEAIRRHPEINVLVNNAGIMRREDATAPRDLADAEATVVTNLLGPIRMIDAFIGHLSGKPAAAVVNVTSGLAFVPLPSTPTYSATKAALHSYSAALRQQLQGGPVEVIEIVPPAVQTELTPGQSSRDGYLPLEAFADEVMQLLAVTPTPEEILVERVGMLRHAEAQGRFKDVLAMLATHG
ncbi:SDR family oxidoreductase [Roseomonas sp. 18066]|uniref:SDR family oxidoreductase n=1 Tax=Roseomonas sp. 18066 TaxID=2681412 RepID=UPI001359141E|nr:SDR family oxidoreductase [Roseomonas sp. 18066]